VIAVVALDAAVWAAWSAAVGLVASRQPVERFDHDNWLTRGRHAERAGHTYERLGIRRWKDRLPEAGDLFRGGVSKRRIPAAADGGLARFAAETRRAEWGHVTCAACAPLFALWNPPWIAVVMIGYGVAVNAPFVAVQRYNRLRTSRALARRSRRSTAAPSSRSSRGTTGNSIP